MNFKVDFLVLLSIAFTCVQCQRGSYAGNGGVLGIRGSNQEQQPAVSNFAPMTDNRIQPQQTSQVLYPGMGGGFNGFNNQPNNFGPNFFQPGFAPQQQQFGGFGFPGGFGRRR